MQNLNKYISGLLFIHDCVILPGFGGFVTNYHKAEHNELNNTFLPPKKDVMFNKNLTYNDGLLINYLAKNRNIPYKKAEKLIRDEVQRAWLTLDKTGKVNFEGVGNFEYDKNGKLIFTPENSENFLPDSYGLYSFRFPPLNYQKNAHNIIPLYNHTSTMNESVKKTLKWAAAAVTVTILSIAALIPIQKHNQANQTAGYSFNIPEEKSIEDIHSAMAVADTNMEEVITKNTDKRLALFYSEDVSVNTDDIKKQNTDGYIFHIIGGSYKDNANATEHAEQFRKKGFDAVVLNTDNLYRISLCRYNDKVNALHELRRIRSEEHNDKVWMLAQKEE